MLALPGQLGEAVIEPHRVTTHQGACRFGITSKQLGGGVAADPALQLTDPGDGSGALGISRLGYPEVSPVAPAHWCAPE